MTRILKVLMVVCAVGIAAVVGIVTLLDSPQADAPAPSPPITIAPGQETSAGQDQAAEPDSPDVDSATPGRQAPGFWIEELTAECDPHEDFAVSALPPGADWRTTERGVYANSPVSITCYTEGSTDNLSYDWGADFGEVQGSGSQIVWTAPPHGARAHVSVVVTDGTGNAQSAQLVFRVATCDCIYDRY